MNDTCVKCRETLKEHDRGGANFGLCTRCYGEACDAVTCPTEQRDCEDCKGEGTVEVPVYSRARLVPDASREVPCSKCTDGKVEAEVCAGKGRKTCAPDGVTCPAREAARSISEAYARERVAPI